MNEVARVKVGSAKEALERISQVVSAYVEGDGPDLEDRSIKFAVAWGLDPEPIKQIWANARKQKEEKAQEASFILPATQPYVGEAPQKQPEARGRARG